MRARIRQAFQWRHLILLMTLREFKRRYLSIGAALAFTFVVSVGSLLVLSAVFGRHFEGQVSVPYPLFVFCGLIPWAFLQSSVSQSVDSFRANANLVRKISFPRELVPLSVVSVNLVVMASSLATLLPFLLYYGYHPNLAWLWLLVAILSVVLLGTGLAMLLSILSVHFIEIRPATELGIMLWFYATPIFYPASIVPPDLAWIPRINPAARIAEIARCALLFRVAPPLESVLVAVGCSLLVFVAGYALVLRLSATLADHVN
ncbi:MAG: ABC transporter permease [Polyangia bacterium]